jgi:hypothetical protein
LAPRSGTWAVVAARGKIAKCSLKAVKRLHTSSNRQHLYILKTSFMSDLFSVKGTVQGIYTLATCCGGPPTATKPEKQGNRL